jgi:dTDP-3-amino-3,4,6-trideoxy-alpha-D-glucose transaminase
MILLNDFKLQWNACRDAMTAALQRVGASGWYILGTEVEQFERAIASRWGLKHAVGVGNGMDAIEISLRCLGLKSGDHVLTTPLTAYATTLAVMRAGGVPVFVDVDDLGQLDLERGAVAVSKYNVRFAIPVHLYGFATTLPALQKLASRGDVRIVEDCAQSVDAAHAGVRCGTVGQMAATSFYPTKNLGAIGDGGAVLTNDDSLAEQAKRLRNYGQSTQYIHDEVGLNSRLDELQAALLREAILPRLTDWTNRRKQIAARYLREIETKQLKLLRPPADAEPVWHLFPVLVNDASKRDAFCAELKSKGVSTGVHYPRLVTDQKATATYGKFVQADALENARRFANCEVSLPIHPFLTDDEVAQVIAACNGWRG